MLTDGALNFVPPGGNFSLVAAAGVSLALPGIIDLLGVGVGVAPPVIIGNVTNFGQPDGSGVGGMRPELNVTIGTACTTGTAATLNLALQMAADTGAAGNYQPGTWYTADESGAIAAANLTANTVIFRSPWIPPFPQNLRPRFVRLYAQIPSGTNFTAGTIGSALVTMVRDDYFAKYAANNFKVL